MCAPIGRRPAGPQLISAPHWIVERARETLIEMPVQGACEARFRHLKFAGVSSGGRPVNLAPPPPAVSLADDALPSWAAGADFHRDDAQFLQWLFDSAGVDVLAYRGETLARRLPACLRAVRATSSAHARQRI